MPEMFEAFTKFQARPQRQRIKRSLHIPSDHFLFKIFHLVNYVSWKGSGVGVDPFRSRSTMSGGTSVTREWNSMIDESFSGLLAGTFAGDFNETSRWLISNFNGAIRLLIERTAGERGQLYFCSISKLRRRYRRKCKFSFPCWISVINSFNTCLNYRWTRRDVFLYQPINHFLRKCFIVIHKGNLCIWIHTTY